MLNYLSERYQFVQMDDRSSELAHVQFGVPQGSILGPVIVNLFVADLQNHLQCSCYQYVDNTTFFLHTKATEVSNCATEMNKVISLLGGYSANSNLALNESKTKWMIISTRQMSQAHGLHDTQIELTCNDVKLEQVSSARLLAVQLDEHLSWNNHISTLLTRCTICIEEAA